MTLLSNIKTAESGSQRASGRTRESQWAEARAIFPIYAAIAKQLNVALPGDKRALPETAEPAVVDEVQSWLDQVDEKVHVHELRHLLQMNTFNASEEALRSVILRHLRKQSRTIADRNKIDFLLVQYFALCAPAKIYHKQIQLSDVAQVLRPVLGDVDAGSMEWCAPLEGMIRALQTFRSLRDILKTDFIEQGRRLKESAGGMFYDPPALLAFIRFNFLLRRTFIELMHADLIAIRGGLSQLEANGVRTLDCQHIGLSAEELITKIRQMADEWKQPFQQDYTERSVNQAFERLLALRFDVDRAVERVRGKSSGDAGAATHAEPAKPEPAQESPLRKESSPTRPTASSASAPDTPAAASLDFETCLETIWEQLIAAPPTPGRSMTTIRVGAARILMSSWEVTAFISADGPAAEDLRRAVVARALVSAETENAKQAGKAPGLERALRVARMEVSRLQERTDIAKQAKDTEAAVNLGISTKRLISALDEAEKL